MTPPKETKILFLSWGAVHAAVQTEGKGPACVHAAADEILFSDSLQHQGTQIPPHHPGVRGMARTSARSPVCHEGALSPGHSGYSSPSAYSASTVLHPQMSGLSAGASPGRSCEAGEVCCMPSVLIQGKLCPRDQQFGSLPKQQSAVSSCAAALQATRCWSLGRNIPIPFLRKGSEVAFGT